MLGALRLGYHEKTGNGEAGEVPLKFCDLNPYLGDQSRIRHG